MSAAARWGGVCPACGECWRPGDLIRIRDEHPGVTWGHEACPDEALSSVRRGEISCPTCWLIHPEGACDR